MLTPSEIQQLNQMSRTLATARNVLRSGGNGSTRIVNSVGAPTLQSLLDRECEQAANFVAALERAK